MALARFPRELWRVPTRGIVRSRPTVSNGTLFVGSWDSTFYAVDLASGTVRWKFATRGIIDGPPAACLGGRVLFTSSDSTLYVLDQRTGRPAWSWNTGSGNAHRHGILAHGEHLYVGTDPLELHALRASDGRREWSVELDGRPMGAPAVAGDTLYCTTFAIPTPEKLSEGSLYAIDRRSGVILWRIPLPSIPPRFGGSSTAPSVSGELVIVGSNSGRLYAFDRRTREVRWTHDSTEAVLTDGQIAGNNFFVGSLDGFARAFECESGRELWKVHAEGSIDRGPFAIGDDFVAFAASDGFVYGVDRKEGSIRFRISSAFNPVATSTGLFVGSFDDTRARHFILGFKPPRTDGRGRQQEARP